MPRRQPQIKIYVWMNFVFVVDLILFRVTSVFTGKLKLFKYRPHLVALAAVLVGDEHNQRVNYRQ